MQVINKFSGEKFKELEDTKIDDAKRILEKGIKAASEMKNTPSHRIYESLYEVSKEIERQKEELAKIIATEAGKPIKYSRGEVGRAAITMLFSAEESKRIYGETIPLDVEPRGINRFAYYTREPIGTVFSVTPFNDPLNLVAHKVGPALAAKNSIINKPASLTPYSAVKLNEIIADAGLPENAMQSVIASGGGEVTNFFLHSDDIKMVTFTGGTEAADKLIRNSGIKKYSMELGSNSPVIVWNDADLDMAAEAVVDAAFEAQGQNCIHSQRILIKEDVYEYFKNRMLEITSNLKMGDPLNESTDVGPMIAESEAVRVEGLVNDAVREGGNILIGGEREGSMMMPTILENVSLNSEIWKKEIFGPATIIRPVKSMEEAIELSNDVPYGLQAGVFTSNIELAMQAIERLQFGAVLINDTSDFRVDVMPFGGMKKSGLGREGIRFSIDEMTEIKLAIIKR